MAEIKYEIKENIVCLSTGSNGWTKEVNLVSWNGGEAKYDIRSWSEDHAMMGKGITLSLDEVKKLKQVLNEKTDL